MFGIGGFELLIILVFGFLIVGPERLPQIAHTIGKALKTFQNARREVSDVVRNDIYDPDSDEPFKDPLVAIDKVSDITKRTTKTIKDDYAQERARQKGVKPANSKPASKQQEAVAQEAPQQTEANKPAESSAAAASASTPAAQAAPARTESFTERRARYERERAAREAQAQAQAAQTGEGE